MKTLLILLALLFCLTNTKAQNYVTINDTSFASWLQINIPAAMLGNQMDTTHIDVTSRRQIIIQNKHIANLDGIQYFDSLITLNCSVNVYDTINIRLSNLPKLPSMLDTIICDGNRIDSLPQLPNGLLYLTCSQNSLDSLPTLPNGIKLIDCWGNQLSSLPTLPDSLIHFNCCNNNLQTMPTLPIGLTTFSCSNNNLQGLPTLSDSLSIMNCSYNPLQTLPALPNKLTHLVCMSNQLSTLPALPNTLTDLTCSSNSLSALPALPNSLINLDCNTNILSSLPALPASLVYLDCSTNQLTTLPSLPNSLNIINCASNNITTLPTLPNALYKLICSNNTSLGSLPALPNTLAILYCDNDGLQGLPALPNSLVDLNCSSNPNIGTLPTLPSSLAILDCHSDLLAALPTLPNSLGALDCSSNQLINLPSLPNSLFFINCSINTIVNLPALPGTLGSLICSNNLITALPTLPTSLANLNCSYNDIHCFDPFNNIPSYFNISNNPFTCLPNYIPSMDSITLRYPLCSAGNAFGCPTSFGIVGFTYKDNNSNCINNIGDRGLKNVPLKIYDNSNNLLGTTYTALNGVYQFLDSANTYNVIVDTIGKPYEATCIYPGLDSTVTVAVLDTNVNFALACKPGFDIGVQSISTCGIVFPGQTHTLRINAGDMTKWYNLNCAMGISGTLSFIVTGPVSYVGPAIGAIAPTVSGNVYTYSIADFSTINNANDFNILLQPYPTALAGDVICVQAKINPFNGDNNLANNTYTTCYNVVNSHDPNIKEVYPIMVDPNFNDWLTYTIHFQNTGNAPAFNIKLTDTLDTELDLTTFQVTDYSHENTTTLNGRILTVNYQNIQLPDSSSNPEGSIGFIQYRLKPKSTWARPYQIKNTAYIYFDFNSPIVTNTTYNSIKDITTSIAEQKESIAALYPNPSNGIFTIELTTKEKQSLQVFDITGNVVLSQSIENGKAIIDANHLAAGIYNISIKGNTSVTNKKMVIVK
jgi:uncharacterized repeat protein (TIGR01451 family)